MTIRVTDPNLVALLLQAEDVVELTDAEGRVLGTFAAENVGVPPPGVKSPFSEEEIAERRKQRTGRPIEDILKDLREKYGE